jgi:sec-independent protein translocase protein TatB
MEFLGIGPLEFLIILVIAIVILGPRDMAKAGRAIAKFFRSFATSDAWRAIKQTSQELENLPSRLVREAGFEDEVKGIEEDAKRLGDIQRTLASEATRTIAPPVVNQTTNTLQSAPDLQAAQLADSSVAPSNDTDSAPDSAVSVQKQSPSESGK